MADENKPGPDPAQADKDVQIAKLTKALADANATIEQLKSEALTSGVPAHLAKMVSEKITAGLPRDTAIEAARAQYDFDKDLAAQKAARVETNPAPKKPGK